MAAQLGLNLLAYIDSDGAGTYQQLGGGRVLSISFDKGTVDITSQDDTSRYRQLLAGGGIKTMSVSFQGVFKDDASAATLRSYWANDTIRNLKVIIPSFYQVIGVFALTKMEFAGNH